MDNIKKIGKLIAMAGGYLHYSSVQHFVKNQQRKNAET